jgi:hypothetical protein
VAGQGSHFVADLSRANGLLIVPEDVTQVAVGETVDVLLLDDVPLDRAVPLDRDVPLDRAVPRDRED